MKRNNQLFRCITSKYIGSNGQIVRIERNGSRGRSIVWRLWGDVGADGSEAREPSKDWISFDAECMRGVCILDVDLSSL